MWVGSLLVLCTMMKQVPGEVGAAREAIIASAKRLMATTTNIGAMAAVAFGVTTIFAEPHVLTHGWLHLKLLFVLGMIVCHVRLHQRINAIEKEPGSSTRKEFGMLHGIVSTLLLLILVMVFLRPF